ncbi:bifunctional 5,10-methylenetetrahydrofolate dehydrogenase/5,10-methenyltetrahydrofolate cyclohydrolase [Williamsoniiplasma lucivorax]|uniref:Bifunctional protein FolD n=1 Tax=Williamsoniiplasma lucivorax TaxID=209274 RepID=A0A2S5RA25_9MOLU|nr:bifunctional 5,10-methylenetetrahydrofolate dehydrogenase/5,10-methenyltetrahydrofolate cyclohydrolase [Williamsoniiplasma lucivorax]PPE04150.1 methylenetetrahydrofolate dehydrogenase/methylenetetrahydrofolate cyclohydrolase [Williamsoniiplasma lucivorax]
MQILDGKKIAAKRRAILKTQISEDFKTYQRAPKLVILLIGGDEPSLIYVKHKLVAAQEVGIEAELLTFDAKVSTTTIYTEIEKLNNDPTVDGILLQLPIPKKFNEEDYLQAIDPLKDADGFNYQNQGKMLQGYDSIFPSTPLGVINLLSEYQIDVQGMNATVIGTSNIVGKPLCVMLSNLGATVTMCNINTKKILDHTINADLIISATGSKFIVKEKMVKVGAVVVDVGIIRDQKTQKLVGDVDFEHVAQKTSFITPVPGGVGPMTIVTLLENTHKLYLKHVK